MKNANNNKTRNIGIFLIVLGLFLAAVMLDVLNLGSFQEYFVWPVLVIFIGLVSLFNNAPAGIIIIAVGGYFLYPRIDLELPLIYEKLYWPAAVILAGLAMLISGITRRYHKY